MEPPIDPTSGRLKGWMALAGLLALQMRWTLTERWCPQLNFSWFLPLLVGWLAGRYGTRVLPALFWLSPLAVFDLRLSPLQELSLGFGFGSDTCLLAVASAVAFCQPRFRIDVADHVRAWWRPAVTAGLFLASCAAFADAVFKYRFGGSADDALDGRHAALLAGWTLEFRSELAVWLGLLSLAAITRWRSTWTRWVAALRANSCQIGPWRGWLLTVVLLVTSVVSLCFWRPPVPKGLGWGLTAGLGYGDTLVPFVGFVLAVNRFTGPWRLVGFTLVAFLVGCGGGHAWHALGTPAGPVVAGADGGRVATRLAWDLLAHVLAAVALGAALAPFWLRREVAALRQWRTPLLLGVVLAAELVLVPAAFKGQLALSGSGCWLLGGAAFVAGLVWRGRALWVVPLLIQWLAIQSLVLFGDGDAGEVGNGSDLIVLALIGFPSAFFGHLANRYEPEASRQETPANVAPTPTGGAAGVGVDISPLARVVRRLDASSTLKAFAVTLTPLLILQNLAGIYRGTALLLHDEFGFVSNSAMVVGFVSTGFLLSFAPLLFLIVDWVIRKDSLRELSALTGATWGALGFGLTGVGLGLLEMGLPEVDRAPTAIIMTVPLIGLTVWLLARARWLRLSLQAGAALATVAGGVWLARALSGQLASAPGGTGEAEWSKPTTLAGALVLAVFVGWWLVRAVRLRIILSGDRPRALLLGALPRRAFWARVAFLMGLPSSLWHRRAWRTLPFWLFLASRGFVFLGFQLLCSGAYTGYDSLRLVVTGMGRWIAGGLLIVVGHASFLLGKQLAAREPWVPSARTDVRPPVLFLRSFEDDQFRFARPWWDLVGRWLDLWSFRRNADETLIDECAQYGPVVALGRPGERQAPFGARRFYARHEDWQKLVTETARAARAIVICAGTSPGVLWEYELLAREQLLDRTLLLFRPGNATAGANEQALAAFQRAVGHEATEGGDGTGALVAWLSNQGQPAVLRAMNPGASAYLLALRAHFQGRQGRELADRALA